MPVKTETIWADRAAKPVLLIRVLLGWVFLSEGIQKFLFPDSLGVGRFVKIGIPWPQVMAPFVGVVEIVCGFLLLMGLSAAADRAVAHRYLRGSIFDEDRHVYEERVLGNVVRSPHGCEHVPRPHLSAFGWLWRGSCGSRENRFHES